MIRALDITIKLNIFGIGYGFIITIKLKFSLLRYYVNHVNALLLRKVMD